MAQYLSPGVYVEEVPSSVKAIAGVSTSTPGFIGILPDKIHLVTKDTPDPATGAARTKLVDFTLTATPKTPYLITNFAQFAKLFGDLVGDPTLPATADTPVPPATAIDVNLGHQRLAHAVFGFFNNGGSSCFVTRISDAADLGAALDQFATVDEIALVAMPGTNAQSDYSALVSHCSLIQDRFAILDGPPGTDDIPALTRNPPTPPATSPVGFAPFNTDFAAWYFPWIRVFDPATKLRNPAGDGTIAVPPSGHLAGIYARVDSTRGVHKAPANEAVRGALAVTQPISKAQQDQLNPKGVNCIRVLNGNIYVWGGRTIGGDANADLKYISVRRTLLFLRESIDEGTQWVVFEPNTPALWAKIRRNITAFLTVVWRSGALFGTTPEEAFFVKCDAETNPPEERELGRVITEIGVAIVRPAEFVIFRISQSTAAKA